MDMSKIQARAEREVENIVSKDVRDTVYSAIRRLADKYGFAGMPEFYAYFNPAIEALSKQAKEHTLREHQRRIEAEVISQVKKMLKDN
jgi:DNA-binding MurR/RpiR family transcriptional regulator